MAQIIKALELPDHWDRRVQKDFRIKTLNASNSATKQDQSLARLKKHQTLKRARTKGLTTLITETIHLNQS